MKRKCELCKTPTETTEMIRCQTDRHGHLGSAFCQKCVEQVGGGGFAAPYHCKRCAPKKPRGKKGKPAPKPKPKKKDRHDRLVKLRKALGLRQPEMAKLFSISPRQYQDNEYSESSMNNQAKILAGSIAARFAPDCSIDWPEYDEHLADLEELATS